MNLLLAVPISDGLTRVHTADSNVACRFTWQTTVRG